MKDRIISLLHSILGYQNYLLLFGMYKVWSIRLGIAEQDFKVFMNLIPKDSTVLDIGANIGVMSVLIGGHLKNGQVIAFEPIPSNYATAKRMLSSFGRKNVDLKHSALGANDEDLQMVLPVYQGAKKHGLSHVVREGSEDKGEIFSVPQQRMDELSKTVDRVAAIKIDVENHEYVVLSNGRQLLERDRPFVFCELWDNDVRVKVMDMFKDMDYAIKIIDNSQLIDFAPGVHSQNNFVFVPN